MESSIRESKNLVLFPTNVKIIEWDVSEIFNKNLSELANIFRSMFETASFNFWDINAPEVKELENMFLEGYSKFIDDFCSRDTKNLYSFGIKCWPNTYSKNGFVKPHSHCSANLIAVYYTQIPEENKAHFVNSNKSAIHKPGDLVLMDPRTVNNGPIHGNGEPYYLSPKEGMMVITTGNLQHMTLPNNSDEKRIVIASELTFIPKEKSFYKVVEL